MTAGVINEEDDLGDRGLKELVLYLEWSRPLHAVVLVDTKRREERILAVYEPIPALWSPDFRRRRR